MYLTTSGSGSASFSKIATTVLALSIVIEPSTGEEYSSPSFHPVKCQPDAGVALIGTTVPSSYCWVSGDMVPSPSTPVVNVYITGAALKWAIICLFFLSKVRVIGLTLVCPDTTFPVHLLKRSAGIASSVISAPMSKVYVPLAVMEYNTSPDAVLANTVPGFSTILIPNETVPASLAFRTMSSPEEVSANMTVLPNRNDSTAIIVIMATAFFVLNIKLSPL